MPRFKLIHANKRGPGCHIENICAIYDKFISFNKWCTTVKLERKFQIISDSYIDKASDNKKVHQKGYMFSRKPGTIFWLTIKQWLYGVLSSKHPEYDFIVFSDFYRDRRKRLEHETIY